MRADLPKMPGITMTVQTRKPAYVDDVVRVFMAASVFWGVVGFSVGLLIASQLAFPALNFGLEWTSFGRLRPVHTSGVIFAFGGSGLIGFGLFLVHTTSPGR